MKAILLLLCLLPLAIQAQATDTTAYMAPKENTSYYPLSFMSVGYVNNIWVTGDDALLYNNKKPHRIYQGMLWYHLPLSRSSHRHQLLLGLGAEVANLQVDGNGLIGLRDWQLPFDLANTSRFVEVKQYGLQLELGYRYYLCRGGSQREVFPYIEGAVSGRILGLDVNKFATSYTFTTTDGAQSYTRRTDKSDASSLVLSAGPRLGLVFEDFARMNLFVGWAQGLNARLEEPMPRLRTSYLYFGGSVAVISRDKR